MGDKEDIEMIKLIKYLKYISKQPDMRSYNDQVFQLGKILNSRIESFIKYYDFEVISEDSDDASIEKEDKSISDDSLLSEESE